VDAVKEAPLAEPGLVQRHPEVRWLAMAAVAVAVVAAAVSYLPRAFRDGSALRVTGPGQLIADVRAPHVGGYAGTILAKVDLDVPAGVLRAVEAEVPVGGALANGSHTVRYWYGGAQRQRIAIIDRDAEQDVFRTGNRVLLWDTRTRTYSRQVIATTDRSVPLSLGAVALTPPDLAERILSAAHENNATTSLRNGDTVEGRSTYELVVRPNDRRSLIGSVHIQIDGRQSVPLSVQIYPRGSREAAVDVYFTSISFGEPMARNFNFDPPPDARPHQSGPLELTGARTIGSDWLSVVSYQADNRVEAAIIPALFGRTMAAVKGKWGSGRVFSNAIMSVLVTNTGRVLFGAVEPSVLYAAARK
jgi:hypothetical protein